MRIAPCPRVQDLPEKALGCPSARGVEEEIRRVAGRNESTVQIASTWGVPIICTTQNERVDVTVASASGVSAVGALLLSTGDGLVYDSPHLFSA